MKKLYSNIGNKVCAVAKVVGAIGCIAFVFGLISVLSLGVGDNDAILPAIIGTLGLFSLFASWPLYAFGQITNDIRAIKTNLSSQTKTDTSELPEI